VSMMDSYNLSWKLVHGVHGLTPKSSLLSPDPVLGSFEYERPTVARQLIDFDSKFSSMFSGAIGGHDPSVENLTHKQFLKVFSDGNGFTSGCGIEYPASLIVHPVGPYENPVHGTDFLNGTLSPGRRLLDVKVRRFADANVRHLQDGKWCYSLKTLIQSTNLRFCFHSQTSLRQAVTAFWFWPQMIS
jgi:phenol 2-monooxygenase (NADPH)